MRESAAANASRSSRPPPLPSSVSSFAARDVRARARKRRRTSAAAAAAAAAAPAHATRVLGLALLAAHAATATASRGLETRRRQLQEQEGEDKEGGSSSSSSSSSSATHVTVQLLTGLTSYEDGERVQLLGNIVTTKAVAAVIAVQHCQERNGMIVEALSAESMKGCEDLTFDIASYDTRSLQSVAVMSYLSGLSSTENATNVVIGTSRSVTSLPISVLANVNRVPVISYWASSSDLSDSSVHGQFFRTIPSDQATAKATADLLQRYKIGHAGMIYVDDPYGDSYRESLVQESAALGIEVLAYSYQASDKESVNLAIDSLNNTNFNVVVVVAFGNDIDAIVSQFHKNGMLGAGRLVIFGDVAGAEEVTQIVQRSPQLAEPLNASQVILAMGGRDDNAAYTRLKESWPSFIKYKDLINSHLPGGSRFMDPTIGVEDNLSGDNFTLQIDDDVFTSPDVVAGFIDGTAFTYDAVAASCRAACMSYLAAGGASASNQDVSTPVFNGEDRRPLWLRGDALGAQLKDMVDFPFSGTSGKVQFDAETGSRVPETASFVLQSIHIDPDTLVAKMKMAGDWKYNWTLADDLIFPGGTQTAPLQIDLPSEDQNIVSQGLVAFAYALVSVVLLLCIALGGWVRLKRRTPVVRRAQPEFLYLFLLGIAIAALSLVSLAYSVDKTSGDPSADLACNAFTWFLSLGSTITATSIVLKLYRIMRIFHNPSLRLLLITASSLFKVMASVLLLNTILLAIPTAVEPSRWERIVVKTDAFENPLESYATCVYAGGLVGRTCLWLLLVFHLSLYIVGASIAYRVRDVDSSFQEGKTLAIAVIWQFQLYLLAAPILLAVSATETRIKFLILCFAIGLANIFALLFVMGPKVHAVAYHMEDIQERRLLRQPRKHQKLRKYASPKRGKSDRSSLEDASREWNSPASKAAALQPADESSTESPPGFEASKMALLAQRPSDVDCAPCPESSQHLQNGRYDTSPLNATVPLPPSEVSPLSRVHRPNSIQEDFELTMDDDDDDDDDNDDDDDDDDDDDGDAQLRLIAIARDHGTSELESSISITKNDEGRLDLA